MRRFVGLIVGPVFALSLGASAQANEAERLEAVAQFNAHSQAGYNDVWGYTDAQGREYALLGVQNGTSVIDVTNVDDLEEIAFIPSENSTWKDLKTYGSYAYAVNETGGGLQVIDLSGLPETAELAYTYDGFSTSHNLFVDTENAILYAEGTHGAVVRVMSLQDPERPEQIATFGVECHDIFARHDRVYVSEGGHGTIGIFDLSDPANPTIHNRFQIPNAGYVHNAWLTENSNYLLTTEETPGKSLKMWDLRDPDDIVMVDEYLGPNELAHNAHIKGRYAYISHYGGGLRILDVADPEQMEEVAYFTKGEETPGGFVHAWGTYPYFDSGKVLVSDISDGLFVVEFEGARRQ